MAGAQAVDHEVEQVIGHVLLYLLAHPGGGVHQRMHVCRRDVIAYRARLAGGWLTAQPSADGTAFEVTAFVPTTVASSVVTPDASSAPAPPPASASASASASAPTERSSS